MLRHLPNLITALRILLVIPLCWLVIQGRHESALMVAALAGLSDAADGFLARRFGWQTWIGGMLDPIADKLLLTAAFVSLTVAGVLPPWLTAVVVGRDLAIVAGAVAYHHLIGPFDAAPSRLSKATTVAQILFIVVELLRLSGWLPVPAALRTVLIILTAGLTLASGVHYVAIWGTRARRIRNGEQR